MEELGGGLPYGLKQLSIQDKIYETTVPKALTSADEGPSLGDGQGMRRVQTEQAPHLVSLRAAGQGNPGGAWWSP